jgi:4'-phosphopantetheinyl transferase
MPVDRLIIPAPGIRLGFWKITESPEELLQMYTGGSHDETIEAFVQQRKSHFIASRLLARQFFPESPIFKDEYGKPHLTDGKAQISWSHSGDYAALIADDHHATGIDIEKISDRIQKIQDKFCNEADFDCIDPGKVTESLLLIWTAKESMYKLYGRKVVDFRLHMTVEPFELESEGRFHARFHKEEIQSRYLMEYQIFNDHIASWVLGTEEAESASVSF